MSTATCVRSAWRQMSCVNHTKQHWLLWRTSSSITIQIMFTNDSSICNQTWLIKSIWRTRWTRWVWKPRQRGQMNAVEFSRSRWLWLKKCNRMPKIEATVIRARWIFATRTAAYYKICKSTSCPCHPWVVSCLQTPVMIPVVTSLAPFLMQPCRQRWT